MAAHEPASRELIRLLEQKAASFQTFITATESLTTSLDSRVDIKEIQSVLAERHRCMQSIDKIDQGIATFLKDKGHHLDTLPHADKERMNSLTKTVATAASDAFRKNKDLEMRMSHSRAVLSNEMLKIIKSKHGVEGYLPSTRQNRTPRFLDVRS